MVPDSATLHDLEVISTSTGRGPTLLGLIDRTRTRAGREQLRRRLTTLERSSEAIVALQQAHQLLAEDVSYRTLLESADCDGAERYLSSNWQLAGDRAAFTRLIDSVWRPEWCRRFLLEVDNGQIRVMAVLTIATELHKRLSLTDSAILNEVGKKIGSLMERPEARELLRLGTRKSSRALLAFDQLARGTAKRLLTDLIGCVATVEAMWSMGVATVENGWCYPRPASRLSISGLFHPFLGHGSVLNDIDLDGRIRVCFVTGPNMAGKSTFLKAIAMAALLAHVGSGVPAASMDFPTVATIFSSVEVVDNLGSGESFYLAEVRRIRALAQVLCDGGSAIAIVDEPFRGTNVHDAAEATVAVITRLADHPAALVFIASHVGEVVPAIIDDGRICLLHFAADLTAVRPQFDYRLREGVSTQRLGMTLLRQEQVLDLLERSARPSERTPEPSQG